MLNLEIIRQRCEELLAQAEREKNLEKRKRFLEYRQRLQEEDCFSNARKRAQNCLMLPYLGFSLDEAYAYNTYMENATEVRGELLSKLRDGSEYPIKTVLNPEIEDYYQFDWGPVFKVRNGRESYYLRGNGVWERDLSLLRRMFEGDYVRIPYRIVEEDDDADTVGR